jgi:hypothetical protein
LHRRWPHDANPTGVAAVQKFSRNEPGFYGFPNANVIRDQHSHWVKLERHYQRDELVWTWSNRQASKAAERACSTS